MLTRDRIVQCMTGILCALCPTVASAQALQFSEPMATCEIVGQIKPHPGQWLAVNTPDVDYRAESSEGYVLELVREEHNGFAYWTVDIQREDGKSFQVHDLTYECRTPLARIASVFDTQVPDGISIFRQSPQIDVALEVRPNRGIPFMMAVDHYGDNALAVGAVDQTGTYRITGRRDGAYYSITVARDEYEGDGWSSGSHFVDRLFVSTKEAFWFDAARGFADVVDEVSGYDPHPIPEGAKKPFYSTWYAFGDDINEEIVWNNAKIASEMGIGNFIVFIGWSECENWFSSENHWGDYDPCESRFSDFAGLVKRMQDELGLAVQVWTAPTWIGSSADTFEDVADERAKWPEGDFSRNLDPRSPKARAHIKKRFAHLAKKWGVDGYYVDFLDTAYNRNDAQHEKDPALFGAGMSEFLEACYEGFSQGEDAPIAEYRVPFANLMTKHHANVFSTTYSDYKFNRNRLLAIMHRPFNDGVLSRCDPLVWSDEQFEDREFITKTLSAVMLCGPPGISMDLTKMRDDRREQLKRWFAFYKKHSDALINGEFRPFGEEYHSPEMMVCNGKTSYAWISRWETGSVPLPEGTEHAFLFINIPRDESFIARFNVAGVQGLVPGRYRAQWFDNALESHEGSFEITIEPPPEGVGDKILSPREKWDFPPDDYRIGLHVKRGGYLELELIEAAKDKK